MDIALIIISSFILIVVSFSLYIYKTNENKTKADRETDLIDLKQLLTDIETKIQETANKQKEIFEELRKEIKLSQDQANSKINSGFEQLQSENISIQKDVKERISDIKITFKDYSQRIQEALTKYSEDSHQSKLEANRLKEQMQIELKNILTEIKAPLDLD